MTIHLEGFVRPNGLPTIDGECMLGASILSAFSSALCAVAALTLVGQEELLDPFVTSEL